MCSHRRLIQWLPDKKEHLSRMRVRLPGLKEHLSRMRMQFPGMKEHLSRMKVQLPGLKELQPVLMPRLWGSMSESSLTTAEPAS
jgi:hypothetical protein